MGTSFVSKHMAVAGILAGAADVAGGLVGPAFAPLVEVTGAAITAGLAAHAVHRIARRDPRARLRTFRVLARVALLTEKTHGRLLAKKALNFACSLRSIEASARASRSILRPVARARLLGLAGTIATAWCPPLAGGARAVAVSRSAFDAAHFLRAIEAVAAHEVLAMGGAA
ncbi:MAG: hypothetical protein NVS3B10_31720 [Polyangiales bacterium]